MLIQDSDSGDGSTRGLFYSTPVLPANGWARRLPKLIKAIDETAHDNWETLRPIDAYLIASIAFKYSG
ncbi:MAG: hypothetical protein CMP96_04555 [Gammaproteobacteria bacterium]|nr:hypothetical protein [Gammaproteobacteria bacterium]